VPSRAHIILSMLVALALVLAAAGSGCANSSRATRAAASATDAPSATVAASIRERETPEARRVAQAAMAQVGRTTGYDASYVPIAYPDGDVPIAKGVCSDVVVRAFRGVGVDLQTEVHKDMAAHFSAYPQLWHLSGPDPNIDHRRVPNLRTYFARRGAAVRVTPVGADYWPGEVVTWKVSGRPHTGVVSTTPAPDGTHLLVTHNIGAGAQTEDVLFAFPITGHYRCF
jgi:uncharacterized protein